MSQSSARDRIATFSDPSFNPYKLHEVTVTNRELGRGSYATVLELKYMGLKCAGKKIHEVLRNESGPDSYQVIRFEKECGILSKIRHPNIVQFLGLLFKKDERIPILVMEFLHIDLTTCIKLNGMMPEDREPGSAENAEVLPKEISYSILHDVALGLHYLHSQTPPIIHRDLSANNVLLATNMSAKISDLGVARILNLTPLQRSELTQTPGTYAYMPPEVMVPNPEYGTSIDVFSYGILMIHIFSGNWPQPQEGQLRTEPGSLRFIPVTEAKRREKFLQIIGYDHPLMDLIHHCIYNHSEIRATTSIILEQISKKVLKFPASFTDRLQMLRLIDGQRQEKKQLLEALAEKESLDIEIDRLQLLHSTESERLKVEIDKEKAVNALLRSEATSDQNEALQEMDHKFTSLISQVDGVLEYLRSNESLQAFIQWKQCQDLPVAMRSGQSVVVNGKVYFGGGEAESEDDCYIVQCYDPSHDNWTTLPPLPVRYFGLGQVNGHLVAVGGELKSEACRSSDLLVFDENSSIWNKEFPPMTIARLYPAVISNKSFLLLAGGEHYDKVTKMVEMFVPNEKSTLMNYLPNPCCELSAVFSSREQRYYALGGRNDQGNSNQAMYLSVDDITLDQADNRMPVLQRVPTDPGSDGEQKLSSPWKNLPATPTYSPVAALLADSVIAIGGWETQEREVVQSKIVKYSNKTNTWIYIGDLPYPRAQMAAVALSSTKVLVIGGWDGQRMSTAVYELNLVL